MKRSSINRSLITSLFALFAIFAIFAPKPYLKYIADNVVGMKPTGGFLPDSTFVQAPVPGSRPLTWEDGWSRSGENAIRVMAVIGVGIVAAFFLFISRRKTEEITRKKAPGNLEILSFLTFGIIIAGLNYQLGASWWDDNHPLYLGRTFFHLLALMLSLAVYPMLAGKVFDVEGHDLGFKAGSGKIFSAFYLCAGLAFGYGLYSSTWHCCKLYTGADYFYFFLAKAPILYAQSIFLFGYGLKLVGDRFGVGAAYVATGLMFGILTPWHTLGFAVSFALFGVALCHMVRKTGSHMAAFFTIWLGYIFHAGLSWRGDFVTWKVIIPVSTIILLVSLVVAFKQERGIKDDKGSE